MTKDPVLVPQRTRSRKKQKLDFYRLALGDKDIRTALYTCDAFIELIRKWQGPKLPYEVSEAFFAAILVSYSRPFTENNFPGLLPKQWRRFAGKELQETHDEMLKNRHSLFAHTDAEIHRMTIIPDGCLPKSIGPKPPQTAYMIRAEFYFGQKVLFGIEPFARIYSKGLRKLRNKRSQIYTEGWNFRIVSFF